MAGARSAVTKKNFIELLYEAAFGESSYMRKELRGAEVENAAMNIYKQCASSQISHENHEPVESDDLLVEGEENDFSRAEKETEKKIHDRIAAMLDDQIYKIISKEMISPEELRSGGFYRKLIDALDSWVLIKISETPLFNKCKTIKDISKLVIEEKSNVNFKLLMAEITKAKISKAINKYLTKLGPSKEREQVEYLSSIINASMGETQDKVTEFRGSFVQYEKKYPPYTNKLAQRFHQLIDDILSQLERLNIFRKKESTRESVHRSRLFSTKIGKVLEPPKPKAPKKHR